MAELIAKLLALEKEGIFTAAAPGKWEGKAGTHVPCAAKGDAGAVVVKIKHVMVPKGEENAEHFIPYIYLKDGAGSVLDVKSFSADDTAPISASFEVKAGVTKVTPFAHCNLHGTWAGDALDL